MKDVEVIKAHNTLSPRARTNFEKRLRVGDRKSTRLNSSHANESRMPSSA